MRYLAYWLAGLAVCGGGAASAQHPLILDPQSDVRTLPPPPPPEAPKPSTIVDAEGEATALISVRVGRSSLDADQLGAAWAPFVGQPLNVELAREIAGAISALYRESDIALYSVLAPRQNLKDGTLDLVAVEGHVADVDLDTDGARRFTPRLAAQAQALTLEKPLTKALMERQILLLRENPGVTVTTSFERVPARPDQVRLSLRTKYEPAETTFAINTRGTPFLGRTQFRIESAHNSIFRAGDRAAAAFSTSPNFESYRHLSASYLTPIGLDGIRLNLSAARLETRPEGSPVAGSATSAGVLMSYPLQLGFRKRLDVSAAFDWLNSENAVFGQNVDTARTRVLRLAVARAATRGKTSANARVTLSHGLGALGARVNPLVGRDDFTKIAAIGGARRGDKLSVRVLAAAQLTADELPTSERFTIGGDLYGRAFVNAVASGDQGWGASLELVRRTSKRAELYGFVDGGEAWTRERPTTPAGHTGLSSAGFGARYRLMERTHLGLELARAVEAPTAATEDDWRFVFSLRTSH